MIAWGAGDGGMAGWNWRRGVWAASSLRHLSCTTVTLPQIVSHQRPALTLCGLSSMCLSTAEQQRAPAAAARAQGAAAGSLC